MAPLPVTLRDLEGHKLF